MLRTGAVNLAELDPLEQVDFIAYEQRELNLRFIEQVNLVYCLSTSEEDASAKIEFLRSQYWVEDQAGTEDRDMLDTDALMSMQNKTFSIMTTGNGSMLEIK